MDYTVAQFRYIQAENCEVDLGAGFATFSENLRQEIQKPDQAMDIWRVHEQCRALNERVGEARVEPFLVRFMLGQRELWLYNMSMGAGRGPARLRLFAPSGMVFCEQVEMDLRKAERPVRKEWLRLREYNPPRTRGRARLVREARVRKRDALRKLQELTDLQREQWRLKMLIAERYEIDK